MMRRIKRFILAENTEKNPNWKGSDNLSTRVFTTSMVKNSERNADTEEKDTDEMQMTHLSVSRLM